MEKEIEAFKARFKEIQTRFEEEDHDHQLVYDLEEEVKEAIYEAYNEKEKVGLEKLNKQIQAFKKEHDFYDPEAELDRMFPDRHDDDFDEDSMSWDSVFGDD